MGFMQPQVEFGEWIFVDGPYGSEVVPADLLTTRGVRDLQKAINRTFDGKSMSLEGTPIAMYCENTVAYSIEKRQGFGARLSAPGYMDCTPWTVFDTEKEAREYLADLEGVDQLEEGPLT